VDLEQSPWKAFNVSASWLQVWCMLGKPTDPNVCWLVPSEKVQSGGRASGSFEGRKIGAPDVYRQFDCPNGSLEPKGPKAKCQLDHLCHTNDQTCPGGKESCQHLLCVNPFQQEPVTTENLARRSQQHRRFLAWLGR
jgi:hypothetical protein